jgi:hypothetical protein
VQFRCIKYRNTSPEKTVCELVTSPQRDVGHNFEEKTTLFYSESNLAHLRRGVKALNAGLGTEHKLIEDDNEEK